MNKYYINEYFIICQNFTEVAVCYNQGITVYIILQQDVVYLLWCMQENVTSAATMVYTITCVVSLNRDC